VAAAYCDSSLTVTDTPGDTNVAIVFSPWLIKLLNVNVFRYLYLVKNTEKHCF
jgi:hypothetical protein